MSLLKSLLFRTSILNRNQICKSLLLISSRQIYGDNFLAIDAFLEQRERTRIQFQGMREKLFSRIKEHAIESKDGLVFTEDLKHLIHLIENKPEEIDLLMKSLKLYTQQNSELRFATFTFGPIVMRCLHHFGIEDIAYQLITDSSYGNFFDQISTYVLAMNILFTKGKYTQVMEIFEQLKTKQLRGSTFHRDCVVLYLAALYKINTADSFKLACQLIKEVREKDATILRKGLTFAAALALNQNVPDMAVEIVDLSSQKNYFTIVNIKLIALAKLNRVSDCLDMLKRDVDRDVPRETTKRVFRFCEEALSAVKEAIGRTNNKADIVAFDRLVRSLREEKLTTNVSFDSGICAPVLTRPLPRNDLEVTGYESRFFKNDRQRINNNRMENRRPNFVDPRTPRRGNQKGVIIVKDAHGRRSVDTVEARYNNMLL